MGGGSQILKSSSAGGEAFICYISASMCKNVFAKKVLCDMCSIIVVFVINLHAKEEKLVVDKCYIL